MSIPSAFGGDDDEYISDTERQGGVRAGSRFTRGIPKDNMYGGGRRNGENTPDRRVPIMHFSRHGMKQVENPVDPQGMFFMGQGMDPSQHLEYLGQRLVRSRPLI
jgi:hypothetical protein